MLKCAPFPIHWYQSKYHIEQKGIWKLTKLSLHLVEASDLANKSALEGIDVWVELHIEDDKTHTKKGGATAARVLARKKGSMHGLLLLT